MVVMKYKGVMAAMQPFAITASWKIGARNGFPICCACGEVAPEPLPPLPPPDEDPPGEDDRPDAIPSGPEAREPEVSEGFLEQLQESGSTPRDLHGMDHLAYDPTCEYCKRALGPMYRHLKTKYGPQIADHTPTLSFDFSGPLPAAVTGARYLMVFVWRLQQVRLLWAFALDLRTKENVSSCLQSVVADLNTLTGGSKPPVARVHSDQAKEFLSHMVMEWLKEQGIRQTFTSTLMILKLMGWPKDGSTSLKLRQLCFWHPSTCTPHFGVMRWLGLLDATTRRFWVKSRARTFRSLDNFFLFEPKEIIS